MFIRRMIAEKREWRRYQARKEQLPTDYRAALDGVERYLMYAGGMDKGDVILRMVDDLADLFEQGAANATPVRDIVGDDPVDFVEEFLRNYSDGLWINRERARLTRTIERVTSGEDPDGQHHH